MNKIRILLIRHGESLGNADHKKYSLYRNADMPLSSLGEFQAIELGQKINEKLLAQKDHNGIQILSSHFLRARKTAELIYGQLDCFYPKNPEKHILQNPDIYEMIWAPDKNGGCQVDRSLVHLYKMDVQNYKFPGGENAAMVYRRANKFLNRLVIEHSNSGEEMYGDREFSKSKIEDYPIRIIISHELFIAHFLSLIGFCHIKDWHSISSLGIANASCFEIMIDTERRKADYVVKIF